MAEQSRAGLETAMGDDVRLFEREGASAERHQVAGRRSRLVMPVDRNFSKLLAELLINEIQVKSSPRSIFISLGVFSHVVEIFI